jgi:hypothetical protein
LRIAGVCAGAEFQAIAANRVVRIALPIMVED